MFLNLTPYLVLQIILVVTEVFLIYWLYQKMFRCAKFIGITFTVFIFATCYHEQHKVLYI